LEVQPSGIVGSDRAPLLGEYEMVRKHYRDNFKVQTIFIQMRIMRNNVSVCVDPVLCLVWREFWRRFTSILSPSVFLYEIYDII